jgi:alpha-beta hydrolase superfamily lysophospholipase
MTAELIKARDSDVLYRRWGPAQPKAVLLLVHGLGAHGARWDFLAEFFAPKGYRSYAIELKGFGQTPDRPRGHVDSFDIYYKDILALLELIKKENPGKKVFILGESMGGLISFILADRFAGQVLISPAFANGMKFPLSAYLTLAAFILIDPKRTVPVPFTAAMCTRDAAYQNVMDNNPDELRVASLKTLVNILLAQVKGKQIARRLKAPTLFLISGKDLLVDENAGRKVFRGLPMPDKTKLEYPEMLHALSIELGREKVFNDILAWLNKRV